MQSQQQQHQQAMYQQQQRVGYLDSPTQGLSGGSQSPPAGYYTGDWKSSGVGGVGGGSSGMIGQQRTGSPGVNLSPTAVATQQQQRQTAFHFNMNQGSPVHAQPPTHPNTHLLSQQQQQSSQRPSSMQQHQQQMYSHGPLPSSPSHQQQQQQQQYQQQQSSQQSMMNYSSSMNREVMIGNGQFNQQYVNQQQVSSNGINYSSQGGGANMYQLNRDDLGLVVSSTPPPQQQLSSPPPLQIPSYQRMPSLNQQQQQQQQEQQQHQQYKSHHPLGSGLEPPPSPGSMVHSLSDQNNSWSIQQVQQLQSQILQLTNRKQQQMQPDSLSPTTISQQQQPQQQPPPLGQTTSLSSGMSSLMSRPSSFTYSTYEESPRSSSMNMSMSSPSSHHRGGIFSSTSSITLDSSKTHSRSISQIAGALNPNASEFNPTAFSLPNSPTNTSGSSSTSMTMADRRLMATGVGGGRASSSTPVSTSFAFSSTSPPSSTQSHTRSLDSSNSSLTVLSPLAQQQQQQLVDEELARLGLPANPFDPREIDAQIARERPDHAAYIYNFRVQVCQAYLEGNCPYDAYNCFQTHARLPRRRKPILQHGRFNYIPTRCRYVIEERECPQGVHCRFSHVTEEVIYHASKFRTQLCSHTLDKEGRCGGYGAHCAKAHGPLDLRQPIFESTEGDGNIKVTADMFHEFVCPPAQRELERKYYMYVYKTKKCLGFPFNCSCDGLDYHREEERRRGPIIKYAPMACPNVKPYLNAEWSKPNVDCSGRFKPKILKNGQMVPQESDEWDCEYAHTLLELMYHPQVYKTSSCDHFDEESTATWKCVWKRRCAHAHGRDDIRSKEEATEDWRLHLLSAFPNASNSPNLARLLSAGQAALENLGASQQGKNRGQPQLQQPMLQQQQQMSQQQQQQMQLNMSTSQQQQQQVGSTGPLQPHAVHRRVSISREAGGASPSPSMSALLGRPPSVNSITSSRSPQLSYQSVHASSTFASSESIAPMSPHSQSPHRAAMHLLSSSGGGVGGVTHSPRSSSLLATAISVPSPASKSGTSSSLGLTSGLSGFFSGSDTGLWAPSPKNLPPSSTSPASIGSMIASPMQTPSVAGGTTSAARLGRFTFETNTTTVQQQRITTMESTPTDPALAWSLDASAEVAAEKQLQLQFESKPILTEPIHVPTPSPDAVPASVAQTLWTSPPTIAAVAEIPQTTQPLPEPSTIQSSPAVELATKKESDWRQQLAVHLECSVDHTHLLQHPITTACCGQSLCQQCIGEYIQQCQSKLVTGTEEMKQTETDSTVIGKCLCGRSLYASDLDQLRQTPIHQSMESLSQWMKQLQTNDSNPSITTENQIKADQQ